MHPSLINYPNWDILHINFLLGNVWALLSHVLIWHINLSSKSHHSRWEYLASISIVGLVKRRAHLCIPTCCISVLHDICNITFCLERLTTYSQ